MFQWGSNETRHFLMCRSSHKFTETKYYYYFWWQHQASPRLPCSPCPTSLVPSLKQLGPYGAGGTVQLNRSSEPFLRPCGGTVERSC